MVAAALALCALGSVPGRAQVKEGFQAQEIAKLQDHLLTHVGDYVASAKRAVVNPETRGESRAYTLADPVAYGQIVPHLITASFAGPVEFLVTVLSICQGSEYGAYCRERIVTKRVGGAAEPAYLERCRRRVLAAGLGDSVRFLGALTVPEVQEELSRASCFVLPSFQENAPLSLAEAMAAGVPAVASRVGGVPEMIEDGASGILVDPNDPHDIGQALLRVLGDDRLARSMGRRGRELALRRHRASAVARRTLAVYREIVGSGA